MRRFYAKYGFDATVLCILLSIVALPLLMIYQNHLAESTMVLLLNGNRDIEITKFVFTGQQRKIICDDMEVCRYLSETLRHSHQWVDQQPSVQYMQIALFFSNGRSVSVTTDVIRNGLSPSIPSADPIESGIPTHTAYFREPVPPKLQQIWDFLFKPLKEISGKVMHIPSEGEPYFTFDQSIWDPN